jgi:type IV secretory pathway VirB2 component (pilin)
MEETLQSNVVAVSAETEVSEDVALEAPAPRWRRHLGSSFFVLGLFLVCATKAHAQDVLSTDAASWTSTLTGGFARSIVTIGILLAGAPMALGQAGDHKKTLTGAMIGGALVLGAQSALSYFN